MPSPDELRTGIASLTSIANDDLAELWAQVSTAVEARAALADILPSLVDVYGEASAALAADWYDELRDEVGAAGRFTAVVADTAKSGGVELARWGVGPLFAAEPDWETAKTLIAGGLQRRIANAARETITYSSIQDRAADGWQRVARGGGCGFCRMLAGRGSVYTKATVDFASHDHCHCVATVAWTGEERPIKPFVPTSRNISDADRTRTQAWIAANL